MSRVLKVDFDAVARQPGTVGAAVGASVEDGGGGGGDLRVVAWDVLRGARRAADVGARRATRGRRRRRRAQIVSNGAVQAEERERGNELGGFHRACVAGRLRRWRRLLFLPVCASFGAALALTRVRQCVRGEGAAMRGARSVLRRWLRAISWSTRFSDEANDFEGYSPSIFRR